MISVYNAFANIIIKPNKITRVNYKISDDIKVISKMKRVILDIIELKKANYLWEADFNSLKLYIRVILANILLKLKI